MLTTLLRWPIRLSYWAATVCPSRAPPPKKAIDSACVRTRVWIFLQVNVTLLRVLQ